MPAAPKRGRGSQPPPPVGDDEKDDDGRPKKSSDDEAASGGDIGSRVRGLCPAKHDGIDDTTKGPAAPSGQQVGCSHQNGKLDRVRRVPELNSRRRK